LLQTNALAGLDGLEQFEHIPDATNTA